MKYCSNCGYCNDDNARYCGNCGTPQVHNNKEENATWVNHLNDYIGNDKPADLNWKVLFTDIFKKHSKQEAEEIFICGTSTTTPPLHLVSQRWPHPWLYSRVFTMFALAFFLLYICCSFFGNTNAVPGLIVIGSFTVPLSSLILFLEINAYKNISLYDIIQIFLVGGCASLVATLFLFSIIEVGELDFIGVLLVGIIEEVGKALIVYLFIKKIGKLNILSGLLIGSAVGAGFAAFESSGYAMNYLLSGGWELMMDVIFLRGFLTPGGHVTWAAISGAAIIISAKRIGNITSEIFTSKEFSRLFIIPIFLHALWDSPLSNICSDFYLIPIVLTIIVWVIVLILINMGLSEIAHYKIYNQHETLS